MWTKEFCPNCGKKNWVDLGDPMDCTLPDIEAYRCFACKKVNIFEDMNLDDLDDPDDPYFTDGKENPE